MKTILALDVAFANIGWAIIEPYTDGARIIAVGSIKNPSDPDTKKRNIRKADSMTERTQKIYRELKEVAEEYKPSGVIAEKPGGNAKSTTSAKAMAVANAVVDIFVFEKMLPAEWTTEAEGKIAMCRNRSASKKEMQQTCLKKFPELKAMVPKSKDKKSISGYEGWFEHAADAIAGYLAAQYGTLVKMMAHDNGSMHDKGLTF